MDTFTLVVASALTAAIMAATMLLRYRTSPRETCLLDWTLAAACFFATNGLATFASLYKFTYFLTPALGNVLYIAGHYMVVAGLRRHLRLRPRYDVLAVLSVLVVLVHFLPFAQNSVPHRLLLLSPLIIAINFHAVSLLWRLPDDEAKSAYLPLMLIELVFMVQLAARAVFMLFTQYTPLTFLGSQFLQTSGSLFVLLFLSVAFMSCALITIRHQELALQRVSVTDSLTGWLNRRALNDLAGREFLRSQRSNSPLSFIMFDIDHFKSINDRYGHQVGDTAIQHVTALSALALRGYDALFRIGGEEFAVLITGDGLAEVRLIGERLRGLIASTPLLGEHPDITITVSIGIATREAEDSSWEEALRRADEALFQSKLQGRNRVSVHAGAGDRAANQPWPEVRGQTTM